MTYTGLDELERAAVAARQWRWQLDSRVGVGAVAVDWGVLGAGTKENADHIVACDPATVAALVRAVRAAVAYDEACLESLARPADHDRALDEFESALAPFRGPPERG